MNPNSFVIVVVKQNNVFINNKFNNTYFSETVKQNCVLINTQMFYNTFRISVRVEQKNFFPNFKT